MDTSEYMRNGDYTPNRMGAQYDAVAQLLTAKLQQHPENTVGLLAFGGKTTRLLASPTEDVGRLLADLSDLKAEGGAGLIPGFKTAVMALRHRKNKNGGQRIVLFVGSPASEGAEEEYEALGNLARRNGIAVDVVCIGENEENGSRLQRLVDKANKENNSHLLAVPAGVLPSDVLSAHPILLGDTPSAGPSGAAGGSGFADFGGIDPSLDPELALAMQMSLADARASAVASDQPEGAPASGPAPAPAPTAGMSDEDALLQQALAMSMAVENQVPAGSPTQAASTGPASAPASAPAPAAAPASGDQYADPDFIRSVLGDLPGVDLNDPALRETLEALARSQAGAPGSNNTNTDSKNDNSGSNNPSGGAGH